jgi:hypothetical protein
MRPVCFLVIVCVQYLELQLDEDSRTRVYDTLEIQNTGAVGKEVYRIVRRYRTFKTIDGKPQEPEQKVNRWTGTFREDNQTLLVNESGKLILFYPDTDAIMLGSAVYTKIY